MPPKLPLSRLSFRWQVLLLGGLVAVLFVAVLVASYAALRYTKASVLSDEKKHLFETTRSLAQEYSDKADFAHRNNEVPPLEDPSSESSNGVLALLSRVVLQNADGVEGGFYARRTEALLGAHFQPPRRKTLPTRALPLPSISPYSKQRAKRFKSASLPSKP